MKVLCDIAFDCGQCQILQQWTHHMMSEGWLVRWYCSACIKDAALVEKHRRRAGGEGKLIWIPGFYQSARDPTLTEADAEYDRDKPMFTHCMKCGWTNFSFLQIIFKRPDAAP